MKAYLLRLFPKNKKDTVANIDKYSLLKTQFKCIFSQTKKAPNFGAFIFNYCSLFSSVKVSEISISS